jgi:Amt family ammonium transporter
MLPDVDGTATLTAHPKDWFFQWAFCATSSTIVSGAVAERIQLPAYMGFTAIMTGIIYPFVVYWTWSGAGFLTEEGYSDFAGSGIVHLTGGIAALVGAIFCGSRTGRWDQPEDFYPHNMGLVALGTFILWFGFYGFNCGSTLYMNSSATAMTAGLVAMNTTMSGSAGGLTVFALRFLAAKVKKQEQIYDLCGACNGILAGLVAICAGASSFEPGMALLVGIFGGLAYEAGHYLLLMVKVDDPLDAFSVHGMGGIAGLLLRPLLCIGGADGEMFGAHVMGMFVIIAWAGGLALAFFLPLRLLKILSYSEEDQKAGSDVHCSPPKAYSMDDSEKAVKEISPPNAYSMDDNENFSFSKVQEI